MTSASLQRRIDANAKYGLIPRRYGDRDRYIATCECGAETSSGLPLNCPTEASTNDIRKRGWKISAGETPVCPDCQKRKTPMSTMIKADPKIARRIYAMLDERFIDDKRIYQPGWSDEKVATTLGVSVEIVMNIRRTAYGELAEDPKVTQLRDDIELLRMEFSDEIAAISKKYYERLSALENALPAKFKKSAG